MHWSMFRDKSLKCKNIVGTIKEKERTKEEQRERPCCGIRLQCTKCTVWPRNEKFIENKITAHFNARYKANHHIDLVIEPLDMIACLNVSEIEDFEIGIKMI